MILLVLQAVAGLAVAAALSRKVNGSLVGGATVFWVAWIMMLLAALVSSELGLQVPPQAIALDYVQEGIIGAFLGSLVGILAAGDARTSIRGSRRWLEFTQVCELVVSRLIRPVVGLTLMLGAAHFFERWERVDFDFFRILELRVAVLSDTDPGWLHRINSYMQLVAGFTAMLAGTADAEYGMRPRRLAAIWLALALPGLALGGRGWTLAPQMIYLLSYFISRQCSTTRRVSLRSYVAMASLIAVGFWAFTVIGTVRNRDLNRDQAESLSMSNWDVEQRLMAVAYLGGSLVALGTVGKAAEQIGPAYGEATLDYFTRKANAWNLPFGKRWAVLERWRTEDMPAEPEYGWTWCVPPTAMAYLLLDYGRTGMPVALGLLVALGHWLSVRWVGQGLFRHLTAVLALNALFASSHSLTVFSPLNVVILFIAALVSLAVRPLALRLRLRLSSSPALGPVLRAGANVHIS